MQAVGPAGFVVHRAFFLLEFHVELGEHEEQRGVSALPEFGRLSCGVGHPVVDDGGQILHFLIARADAQEHTGQFEIGLVALISGLLRQGVGDGRQLDRHLHLAVEEQALALHDEDHLRVLRAFLEGRVGVGFSPVPQVPDDEFEAEQGFRGLLVQFLVQIPHHEFAFLKRGVREEEAQIVGHPGFGNLGPDRGGHCAEQGRRDCAAGPRRFGPCGKAESFQIQ